MPERRPLVPVLRPARRAAGTRLACMPSLVVAPVVALVVALLAGCAASPGQPPARGMPSSAMDSDAMGALVSPRLGQPIDEASAAAGSLTVFPDGRGLPPGRGTAAQGAPLFDALCASCHGPGGRGATAEELAGGRARLDSPSPDKTIGLYWPHATTVFDFTRRAMPMHAPGSLSADQVYALTAYLLHANGLIGEHEVIDAATLPRVRMPNRDGFDFIDARP